jgi:hypothetical protein
MEEAPLFKKHIRDDFIQQKMSSLHVIVPARPLCLPQTANVSAIWSPCNLGDQRQGVCAADEIRQNESHPEKPPDQQSAGMFCSAL